MGGITGLFSWGDNLATILQEWEYLGIFEFALPFLLIFALVFGILYKSKLLGDNKGVITVIALAVGMLAITSQNLRAFFRVIFPYAGIGLSILVVVLILMGLFTDTDDKWYGIVFYVIGGLIALIVIISALSSYEYGWFGGWWWQEYWPAIVAFLVIGGLVTLVILATKNNSS
jgi:hypothetical protein